MLFFFLMRRRPSRSTRTDTLFPYTTLVRSKGVEIGDGFAAARLKGEENADAMRPGDDGPRFLSNHAGGVARSEVHTSELQSLMRNSYAVFCLKKKNN